MGDTSTIAASAQAAGGVAAAAGEIRAGRFNSRVDRFNAKIAGLQAQDSLRRGEESVATHREQVVRLKGAQRAALAAQGIVVDQDTAADILADTDTQAKRDEQMIRTNAALEAWGFRVQQVDHLAQARVATATAQNQALGTIMSTVGRFGDSMSRIPRKATTPAPATEPRTY